MPLFLNMPDFSLCQVSEYDSSFEYTRVLNKPEFRICQGSEYTKALNMPRLRRVPNISDYAWLNMFENAGINLILPKWFLFYVSSFKSLVYLNVWLLISTFTRT